MKSPFKFLDAYTLEDKDVFFGRDKEVEDLYDAVSKNRLVLVYGQSGTGKTSLVQCGLASRFDATDWYPLFIRRQDDINRSLRQALEKAAKRQLEGGLADGLQRLNARFLRPIYLIFDQLEELLILGGREEQQAFIRSLQDILNARELSCHLILILREEYIAHLYPFEQAIPTLFDRRLRVEAMTNARVREVLRSSFNAFNISLEQPAENLAQIIENVSAGRSGIQLPYLQVYLDMLWRKAKAEAGKRKPESGSRDSGAAGNELPDTADAPPLDKALAGEVRITNQQINELGRIEAVLEKFLQEQEVALQQEMERQYPGFPEQGVRQILDVFVTAEGTKRPAGFQREGQDIILEEKVAKLLPSITIPPSGVGGLPITTCLEALARRRLLRFSDDSIELAHDSLAELIDKRRSDEQRQLNELKVRLAGSFLEWQRSGEYLTRKQLIGIEPFLDKLALEPHLERFVQESYAYNEQVEEAERQKQQAELEKERRLRGEAEKAKQEAEEHAERAAANARQARRRTRMAWIISALALVIAGFAFWQFEQAKSAKSTAEKRRIAAEQSDSIAQIKAEEARLSDSIATMKADEAEVKAREAQKSDSIAQGKARETQIALSSLETNTREAMPVLIRDIDNLILSLDYEKALARCKTAWNIDPQNAGVSRRFQEIAFFFTESGAYGKAENALGYIGRKPARPGSLPARRREELLSAIKRMDAKYLKDSLEMRYYPEMIPVKGGSFCMGRGPKETGSCDTSGTEVVLGNFRMGKTEVTVWQYNLYCTASGQDSLERIQRGLDWELEGNNPVVKTSWYDAVLYCNWLSRQKGLAPAYSIDTAKVDTNNLSEYDDSKWIVSLNSRSNGFRLPTEAEWEYAARGGIRKDTFLYSGSDDLGLVAWWWDNSSGRTRPAATKNANRLGLHDMSGNVWEWCWDWYANEIKPGADPHGPVSGSGRLLRGGSWYNYFGRIYEVTDRSRHVPDDRNYNCGFRLSQD